MLVHLLCFVIYFYKGLLSRLSLSSSHGRACVSPILTTQQRNQSSKIKVDFDQSTGEYCALLSLFFFFQGSFLMLTDS